MATMDKPFEKGRLKTGVYRVECGGYMPPYKRIAQMVRAGKALKLIPEFVDPDSEVAPLSSEDLVFTNKRLEARSKARREARQAELQKATDLAKQAIIDEYLQSQISTPSSEAPKSVSDGASVRGGAE